MLSRSSQLYRNKMSKCQHVDLMEEEMPKRQCVEKKKICEVHLQNPSLLRAAISEFMVTRHGYQHVG